ncbi:EAL domain-containing protein [Paucibacter sp. AS339]|uniref:EAL domain-containing protein n=1 Tax=Paucibacter hankyongi TaxID=3133434 RepID=UPI0030A1B9A2
MSKPVSMFAASSHGFTTALRLGALLVFALFAVFAAYVLSEKQVDLANEQRFRTIQVGEELRQSSDDLTRMVRSYVVTGNPSFRQHYLDILAIRDGRLPRPAPIGSIYWDLLDTPAGAPASAALPAQALLDIIREQGISPEELTHLTQAKQRSDELAKIELHAIGMVDGLQDDQAERRQRASLMLNDASYLQAKADIMGHIQAYYRLIDARTLNQVQVAEWRARMLWLLLSVITLGLLGSLMWVYRALARTLGASPVEIHAQMTRIGQGDFSQPIRVSPGLGQSVLGWLAQMQAQLHSAEQHKAEAQFQRDQILALDALRVFMMEQLTSPAALAEVLEAFIRRIEAMLPGTLCSILLLDDDGVHLRMGAAPSLPAAYNQAIDGVSIGPSVGSCGTAAYTGQRVIVEDIASHPFWKDFAGLAAQAGLAACWSEPIRSGERPLLGTFAMYRSEPSAPSAYEIAIIETAARLTALAIERKRAEMQLQLLANVFEHGNEVIMIADSGGKLLRVNKAFSTVTGYTDAEVLGRNPRMLSSGRQDRGFYRAMWETIQAEGQWSGEVLNRRKGGGTYPQWLSISALRDAQGEVSHYIAMATDISQRKEAEERIRMLAEFDPLTQLPNRRLLQDRVHNAIHHARRHQEPLGLIFLDLDRFKNVNDSLGHHVGDALLVAAAERFSGALREEDTVSRVGGDEFVVLCPNTDANGVAHVAGKLLAACEPRYHVGNHELAVSCSLGIAMFPADGESYASLSMCADTAMYRAKQAGRNTYRFFTPEMQSQSARTLLLENELRQALELGQLHLVYQPQVDLVQGSLRGAEVLLRWTHPTLGTVSPAEFIPIAEESGLIVSIGAWVMRSACEQLCAWRAAGLALPQVAVNLSVLQFREAALAERVSAILRDTGLPPECLELELTEGIAMDHPDDVVAALNRLHELGVCIAIDDFGTGYSSLSYLKRFRIDRLKIDQSFVRDIHSDADDRAIVATIIGLARSLGCQTIAEGVETEQQLAFLRQQGCDQAQGYLISRPLAAQDFERVARELDARSKLAPPLEP